MSSVYMLSLDTMCWTKILHKYIDHWVLKSSISAVIINIHACILPLYDGGQGSTFPNGRERRGRRLYFMGPVIIQYLEVNC